MDPLIIGCLGIFIIIVLMLMGMPVGFTLLLVGTVGIFSIIGWDPGLSILRFEPYRNISSYTLSTIPLFILMGSFCFHAGISYDLYNTLYKWMGRLRGGLAMATVGACACFAALSGSSIATAATMGMVALPEMKRFKYDDRLATGAVAAGGTLGSLIPPSIGLIIYALIAEESIAKLFAAGLIPGILEAIFYITTIYLLCKYNPQLGPRGKKVSFLSKVKSIKDTWMMIVIFIVIMGGIYLGIFTPTEAAGIGAFGSLLFALGRRRVTKSIFVNSLMDSINTTILIFIIVIGANVFSNFLGITRLPWELANVIISIDVNRYIVLAIILVIFILLGCIMEGLSITLLTVPIFLPVVKALGFDPVWFGILMARTIEVGFITPPLGINVFVIRGVAQDVPVTTIFRGIFPFLVADIFHILLLLAIPQISLFLPNLLY